jgi:hypothetical protein
MRTFSYVLDGESVTADVEGDVIVGGEEVLAALDDDLTRDVPWHEEGFTVVPFLTRAEMEQLRAGIAGRIARILTDGGIEIGEDFRLEEYHHVATREPRAHEVLFQGIRRGLDLSTLPVEHGRIEERVGEVLGIPVTARNEIHGLDVFNLRVVRPQSADNNPPHRDVWLDRLRNAVNIYVPIAGSDARSSLPLVPGSHRWSEGEIVRTAAGARVQGATYTVPAVVGATRPLTFIRPDPAPDQFLLFSPYLIHGGARNANHDRTRVSLEMRFWRKS